MKKLYFLLFAAVTMQMNAQYCEPTITNNCGAEAPESIANVTFGDINNDSSCDPGINDYTDQVAEVALDETYELSVTITTDVAFPDDYAIAYIDWNQDEFWDAGTEIYPIVGPTGTDGTYSIDITVPSDATLGETRMRVLINWNQPDYDGCMDPMNYGEIEDYTVNVVEETASLTDNAIAGFSQFYSTQNKNLTISANDAFSNITMFNIAGQQVISKQLSSNNEVINLSSLTDGVYLANVTANGKSATFKIVKK